jgi:hypothetical protein
MNTTRRIFSIILLLLIAFNTTVKGERDKPVQTIRGRITDAQTTLPLPGASIELLDTEPPKGTISDNDGYFELKNVPVGRVSLRFGFVGYHSRIMRNVQLQSGKELVLNIELEERLIETNEVTIVAQRDKTKPGNELAKVSARSFTVEETERYAGTRNDVARMAQNYAGVMGNDDSRNDIIIRGNSPTGLLWRLDGLDIPNPNHFGATGTTGGPVSMLNNTLLSNSYFMTGAFPAQYGNATAGVFDLKMRQGNNRTHEFLGQVGFNGFELGAEGPVSEKGNSSFLTNYRYSTLSLFEKLGINFGTSGVPYYQDLSFKVNFPSTPIGKISVFGLGGISDIEIWDSRNDKENREEMYGETGYDLTNGVDMGLIGISSSKIINENTYIKTTAGISGHQNRVLIDSLSDDRTRKFANYRSHFIEKNATITSYINRKINSKHLYRAGVDFKHLWYAYNDSSYNKRIDGLEVITDETGNTTLWQPWFQWHYRLTDKIELTAGLHFSHFGLTEETSIEPRAAFSWEFKTSQTLSLGYGLHSQTPPLYIYFSRVRNDQGQYITPNTNLAMTKSRHLVFGYDRLIGEKTRLKLETYYQHLFDVAVDKTRNTSYSILNEGANFYISIPDYLESSGTGWNYGIELTLERFLHIGINLACELH